MAKDSGGGKGKKWLIILGVIVVLGVIGNMTGGNKSTKSNNSTTSTTKTSTSTTSKTSTLSSKKDTTESSTSTTAEKASSNTSTEKEATVTDAPTQEPAKDWLAEYASAGTEVVTIPADILYEYGSSYVGKTVVTSIKVEDKTSSSLKANTSNNDTYSFSIVADFPDKTEIGSVSEGSTVIVSGVVDEMGSINLLGAGKTVNLKKCHLITTGITSAEIEGSRDTAAKSAEDTKAAAEKAAADAAEAEIQSYIKSCEKVKYSDVERNPSQYKGKKIQVTGTVIQVSEGWFNSVTLRVEESGGNIWYVNYKRADDEPRILEKDKLTFYGECTGVESYTTIVGSTVTIPAMDAKYYK